MFEISSKLRSSVESKDVRAVQDAIVTYLQLDPFNKSGNVDAAIRYAQENGVEVYSPHDDSIAMDMDRSHWTSDYTPHIVTTLLRNFSRERIDHWKEVAKEAELRYEREHPQPSASTESPSAGTGKNAGSHPGVDPVLVAAGVAVAAVIVIGGIWWLSTL